MRIGATISQKEKICNFRIPFFKNSASGLTEQGIPATSHSPGRVCYLAVLPKLSKLTIETFWTLFEHWLKNNAPSLLDLLNPGAQQSQVAELEFLIGKKLPPDFIQFYAVHDGQSHGNGRQNLINCEELLPIEYIIHKWKMLKQLLDDGSFFFDGEQLTSEPEKGINNYWWSPSWIPFTHDGSGNYTCIDLDPTIEGKFGQVIRIWHDVPCREMYAKSFGEYFSNYLEGLESGKYVFVKEWGLVEKDSPFNNT